MKEFMLIFRRELTPAGDQPSPDQYQGMVKKWQDWIGGLAAQNKLVATGKRMAAEGKVVHNNKTVTNGPFVEIKEGLAGYIFVNANDIDEAADIAKGCPVLDMKGNVEVRQIMQEGHW